MATLTIRNLDDTVARTLKKRAKDHNRSVEAEVRQILQDVTRRRTTRELQALARQIADMTPDVPQTDSTELIREDRDR